MAIAPQKRDWPSMTSVNRREKERKRTDLQWKRGDNKVRNC